MANSAELCEVTVGGAQVRVHRGDSFFVDDRGHLFITMDKSVMCVYAPGQWVRAHMAGNLQTK